MITPYLQVEQSQQSIAWYRQVFDAKLVRPPLITPDGVCMNAELEIHGSRFMIADHVPHIGSSSPNLLGATSVVLNIHVTDAREVFKLAIDNGGRLIFPVSEQFYGDIAGRVCDPFGHHWIVATKIRELPEKELMEKFRGMF